MVWLVTQGAPAVAHQWQHEPSQHPLPPLLQTPARTQPTPASCAHVQPAPAVCCAGRWPARQAAWLPIRVCMAARCPSCCQLPVGGHHGLGPQPAPLPALLCCQPSGTRRLSRTRRPLGQLRHLRPVHQAAGQWHGGRGAAALPRNPPAPPKPKSHSCFAVTLHLIDTIKAPGSSHIHAENQQ